MKLVSSTYRFTRSALSALLCLVGAKTPPGTDLIPLPQSDDTLKELIDAGFIMPTGNAMIIDRAVMLLLSTISQPQHFEVAEESGFVAVLFHGEKLDILLESVSTDIFLLTPITDKAAATKMYSTVCKDLQRRYQMYANHNC